MKKKHITLEEALALRGTDTKIYNEELQDGSYHQFVDGILCLFMNDKLAVINETIYTEKFYILEPEEFRVEKTGKFKTRDSRVAYVSVVGSDVVDGVIEGNDYISQWDRSGVYYDYGASNSDLVEYIGD